MNIKLYKNLCFVDEKRVDNLLFKNLQRGLHYGDGFWDSLLVVRGKIRNERAHRYRYEESVHFLGLCAPAFEYWSNIITQIDPYKDLRIRLTVVRQEGGRYEASSNLTYTIIEPEMIADIDYNKDIGIEYECKIRPLLEVIETDYSFSYPGSELKLLGMPNKVWLSNNRIRREEGSHFALYGKDGLVCVENGNIFFWDSEEKTIYTPPLTTGAIAGCTRAAFLEYAKNCGYKIVIQEIKSLDQVKGCYVFSTNSFAVTFYSEFLWGGTLQSWSDKYILIAIFLKNFIEQYKRL